MKKDLRSFAGMAQKAENNETMGNQTAAEQLKRLKAKRGRALSEPAR